MGKSVCWAVAACVWAGGAVGAAAADPQWQPTTAAGGKNLAALVRRLGAARYAERVKAQEELLKLDAGAVPAILDVLAREKLNAEAVERARQVVVQLRIPQFGAVWRDVAGGMRPEGVQAGDVVLACGDVPIRCKADLEAYTAGQPSPRVRVWRKGQELFLTRMAAINECLFGFRDWPDEQARYETSGHRGEWDQAVETALADYRSGDPRSAEELAKAWEQGCRDGVVLLAWARRLEQSGELAGAQQVLRARMGQAVDRSFGADLLHFDLPLEDARIAWLDGNEPEAMRLLDAAIGKAAAGGLSRQAARLHSQKVLWMFWRDPPGAMAYWRSHAGELLAVADDDLLGLVAGRMASEGKLDEAIRFLAARPPTGRTVTYRALLEKQAAALKAAGRTAAELAPRGEAPAHRMLVWLRPEMVTVAVKPSLMQSRSIPRPPLPGAVECEMRLAGAPAQIDAYETFLMLILCDPGPSHMATVLKRNGGMIVSQGLSIAHPPESPSGLFRWHAIRFEQDPNVMRLYIDGKLRRAWYGQVKPGTQDMTLRMRACTGECRNVRYYVPAPAAFDSTRVEKLLGQFADATLNADPARARQAHAELLSLWQASPHAAPAAERLSARLKLLADALSPKGADLLGPDLRKLWFVHRGSARITDKGIIAWASDRWDTSCAVDLPFAAKAFELSGLLDLRRIGGLVMGLHWNAHDCCPTNYLRIHMPERKAFFGDVKARGAAAALPPTNVPFGFCLRVRGPDAVLFVGDGGKPAIRMSAARIEGNKLLFSWILPYTRMRVDVPRLKLRYLAPDKALDAPAELPKPP